MGEGRFVPNNLAVDSAGDTVLQLEVHLGDGVVGEDGGVRDITCKGRKNAGQFRCPEVVFSFPCQCMNACIAQAVLFLLLFFPISS